MRATAPVTFAGRSADEPLVLSGPPGRVAGRLHLRNPNAASLVLRQATLSDRSGRLGNTPMRHPFAPIVLRAEEERAVEVVIELDRAAPPGEHRVEFDIMGQVRPAILTVSEHIALGVEPNRIVVMEGRERPIAAQICVSNEGNVSFAIHDIGDVDLTDDTSDALDLRAAVALLDDFGDRPDRLAAALVALGAHPRPVVARLSVRMPAGTVRLDPGQTAKIELEIVVPRALPERGRYRGTAAILTADLEFIVIAAAAARAEPAPGAASPAKRAIRRSARKTR
jgi:hypothetical protein